MLTKLHPFSACSEISPGAVLDHLPDSECASLARAADRTAALVATERSSIAVGRRRLVGKQPRPCEVGCEGSVVRPGAVVQAGRCCPVKLYGRRPLSGGLGLRFGLAVG